MAIEFDRLATSKPLPVVSIVRQTKHFDLEHRPSDAEFLTLCARIGLEGKLRLGLEHGTKRLDKLSFSGPLSSTTKSASLVDRGMP